MPVIVLGNGNEKLKEFLGSFDGSAVPGELYIDFGYENNPATETLSLGEKKPAAVFMINSVCGTLGALPRNFIRFNGWNSFLERTLIEASASDADTKRMAEEIFKHAGKKIEWVPDVPGFLTARVVAMIINEAYFTLQDQVSSREEIDIAMKLGTNYPFGPFEWSRKIGLKNILGLLEKLSETNPRYAPALLLKQEASSS